MGDPAPTAPPDDVIDEDPDVRFSYANERTFLAWNRTALAMMTAGLIRIGEVANRISNGEADRGVAHATSGPCLQQNLVTVLEGEN